MDFDRELSKARTIEKRTQGRRMKGEDKGRRVGGALTVSTTRGDFARMACSSRDLVT